MLRVYRPGRRRPLRQDGAQRHRIRRHAAHRGNLRCPEIGLRTVGGGDRRRVRGLEIERARIPISSTSPPRCCARRDATGGALVDRHSRRSRAEGHRALDGPVRARTRRADHGDHRGGLRPRPVGRRDLRATRQRGFPPRRTPLAQGGSRRRSTRFGDALYASKIVAYAQGFEQMGAASAQYGWRLNLARSRRSGAAAASSALACSTASWRPTSASRRLPTLLLADHFRDAVVAAEGAWRQAVALAIARRRRDPGLLVDARLLRRLAPRPRTRQPAAGPARLFRRAHLSPARQARRVSYPLEPGRRRGSRGLTNSPRARPLRQATLHLAGRVLRLRYGVLAAKAASTSSIKGLTSPALRSSAKSSVITWRQVLLSLTWTGSSL